MENKEEIKTWHVLLVGILMSLITYVICVKPINDYAPNIATESKEDSLKRIINDLIIEKENDEDGWDKKERRYEEIIFEYEFGLDHLKHYQPEAYKEFHRIIGYREKYSHEAERENKKRLNEYTR